MKTNSEKGMAILETIPLLSVFVLFVAYGIGSFGIIHTGILNSISARTYAFETFRHRPQLRYLRDSSFTGSEPQYYKGGTRLHGITSDANSFGTEFIKATERAISRGLASAGTNVEASRQPDLHREIDNIYQQGIRNGQYSTSIAWIKVMYGICLDSKCGEQ